MIEEVELFEDMLDVLASKGHRIAEKEEAAMETLLGETLLIAPRQSRTRLIIDHAFIQRSCIRGI